MARSDSRLDSWKAISGFLGRDVSTARRWEKESGLPVHRAPGNNRRAVYAYKDELDAWLRGHYDSSDEPQKATGGQNQAVQGTRSGGILRISTVVLLTTALAGLLTFGSVKVPVVAARLLPIGSKAGQAARDAYSRGRHHWNTRTADGLRTAIEYFNEAIEKNPRYAPAYAGLADSYTLLGLAGGGISAADVAPRARVAALKAVELDKDSPEAHNSLGGFKAFYEWDWPGAEREFQRALELNPEYAPAHHWYGIVYLAAHGLRAESIVEMQRAVKLDPESAIYATDLGWAFYLARRYDDAIAEYRRVLGSHPNFAVARFRLSQIWPLKGIYSEAGEYPDAYSAPTPVGKEYVPQTRAAYLQQLRAQIEAFTKLAANMRISPYYFAEVHARLDEPLPAIEWLEKAYDEHEPALIYIWADPLFGSLHTDARFLDLVRKIGVGPPP